jgi:hypothetical protein
MATVLLLYIGTGPIAYLRKSFEFSLLLIKVLFIFSQPLWSSVR